MFFTIHCTVAPAKVEELDQFILTRVKLYWQDQQGMRGVRVRGVGQVEWPARSITIEIDSVKDFRHALDSQERRALKETLARYVTHVDASAWLRKSPLVHTDREA